MSLQETILQYQTEFLTGLDIYLSNYFCSEDEENEDSQIPFYLTKNALVINLDFMYKCHSIMELLSLKSFKSSGETIYKVFSKDLISNPFWLLHIEKYYQWVVLNLEKIAENGILTYEHEENLSKFDFISFGIENILIIMYFYNEMHFKYFNLHLKELFGSEKVSFVKKDTEYLFKIKMEEDSTEICAICRNQVQLKVKNKLNCNHYFHPDCVMTWILEHNSCPLCKEKVIGK